MPQEEEHPRMRPGDARTNLKGLLFQGDKPELTLEQAIAKFGMDTVLKAALATVEQERHNSRKLFHFPPTVFVSYRRSTPEIEEWARLLVQYLRARGYVVHFDMENPVTEHLSIPSFIANLPHSDFVVVLNTKEYADEKARIWIKEERHAAILYGLQGTCDLLVLKCDDAPFADVWMEAFPTLPAKAGDSDFSALDSQFPPVPSLEPEEQEAMDALLEEIKSVLHGEMQGDKLVDKLEGNPKLLTTRRAREVLAVLRPENQRTAEDEKWLDAFNERFGRRRLKFAQFMSDKGNNALAITSLRPFLRGDHRLGAEAHCIIGGILEQAGRYNEARNHYNAAHIQSMLQQSETQAVCLYGIAACALKLFEGKRAVGSLERAKTSPGFNQKHALPVECVIMAAKEGKFAQAIWSIEHDIRNRGRAADVHSFTQQEPTILFIHCDMCYSEFDVSDVRCHVCACCGCSFPDPENVSVSETHNLRCPVCSHTGEIAIRLLISSAMELGCPICGLGRLSYTRVDESDPIRQRFAIKTTEQFFEMMKLR